MRRLMWGFAGRTYHIVGNTIPWLNCLFKVCMKLTTNLTYLKTGRTIDKILKYVSVLIVIHAKTLGEKEAT